MPPPPPVSSSFEANRGRREERSPLCSPRPRAPAGTLLLLLEALVSPARLALCS